MKTVAFVSDTHADERKKWDEHCRVMEWIADDIASKHVDLVCHAGDIFDGASTPLERTFVAEWIRRVTENAPLCIVAGNHDRARDVEYVSRLRTKHPVIAVERPGVHVVAGVAVAMLPWPRLSWLLAALGRDAGHEQSQQVAVANLQGILTALGAELAQHDGPKVLVAHAMVDGSKTDTRQPLVGCDLTVTVADLALSQADLMVAGHVHAEQQMRFGATELVVPGCPYHRTFGEPGPTSYVMAEWGDCVRWERVPVPASPMLLLEADWDTDRGALIGEHRLTELKGVEARLRYRVTADQRTTAKKRADEFKREALAKGAIRVHLDEVVEANARPRAPEVAAARTLDEKLTAHWKSKGIELSPERQARVLAMGRTLEAR